jgi:hypothetical protein
MLGRMRTDGLLDRKGGGDTRADEDGEHDRQAGGAQLPPRRTLRRLRLTSSASQANPSASATLTRPFLARAGANGQQKRTVGTWARWAAWRAQSTGWAVRSWPEVVWTYTGTASVPSMRSRSHSSAPQRGDGQGGGEALFVRTRPDRRTGAVGARLWKRRPESLRPPDSEVPVAGTDDLSDEFEFFRREEPELGRTTSRPR